MRIFFIAGANIQKYCMDIVFLNAPNKGCLITYHKCSLIFALYNSPIAEESIKTTSAI